VQWNAKCSVDIFVVGKDVAFGAVFQVNLLADTGEIRIKRLTRRDPAHCAVVFGQFRDVVVGQYRRGLTHNRHADAASCAILVGVQRLLDMGRGRARDDRDELESDARTVFRVAGRTDLDHRRPGVQLSGKHGETGQREHAKRSGRYVHGTAAMLRQQARPMRGERRDG